LLYGEGTRACALAGAGADSAGARRPPPY